MEGYFSLAEQFHTQQDPACTTRLHLSIQHAQSHRLRPRDFDNVPHCLKDWCAGTLMQLIDAIQIHCEFGRDPGAGSLMTC